MEYRFLVAILVLLVVALHHQVEAEFNYNRYLPKEDELAALNLKCIPGRTVIKITEKPVLEESSETDDDDGRRSHMTFTTDDETCQVCVCSAEGKDIYCSKRPAKNVNECIRITTLDDAMHKGLAMEHDRDLATRIRRDLIWHKDEIPYRDHAKCKRGMSYYTNSVYANDTDIDVPSDIDSLLDYSNTDVCFFCICHTHGEFIACIPRNPWYCQYYRDMRNPDYARNSYRILFEQDRPTYFRQLSYRLRRTMDSGMFDLMDAVGNGNKEQYCVPFVSTYTDCNEANQCDGCKKCKCSAVSQWECEQVHECLGQADDDNGELANDLDIDLALEAMVDEMKEKEQAEKKTSENPLVPLPEKPSPVETLLDHKEYDVEDEILAMMNSNVPPTNLRNVRAAESKKTTNGSVKFFNIKDDMNEDTLKAENISGTLKATRMVPITQITRRSGLLLNSSSKFQIEYTPPKMYQPLTDNKIDTPHDAKVNNEAHDKVSGIIGNYSQVVKNKDISKVVVSELTGDEVIGTVGGPVISNITFQPDNSTSAAIALIAGTLLYHLWNMEKNGTTGNIDLDKLKHERISNLLEMFREPLNIKQETFLKDALVKISSAFDKNKMVENVSICQNIPLNDNKSDQESEEVFDQSNETNHETTTEVPNSKYIADLIQKYNAVQEKLKKLKSQTQRKHNKETEHSAQTQKPSFNKFGTMLQTIFQELMPKKGSENVVNRINNMNVLTEADAVKLKLKKLYNIDIGNISVSAKDRIVLDYLTHIQNKPKCVLDIKKPAPVPALESNILLNLSEFFKMKSMSDLIKLIKVEDKVEKAIENEENKSHLIAPDAQTESINKAFFRTFDTESEPKEVGNKSPNKVQIERSKLNKTLDEAKNKLRQDLLTIVQDLIDLRKMNGQTVDTNDVKLTELLPCVSNLFDDKKTTNKATVNTDTNVNTNKNLKPSDQVKIIVDALSKETKLTQTRRTNSWSGPRPKSAVVWDRILTAVHSRRNNTRRNMRSNEPKSIKEIKEMIKKLESSNSNSFKRYAYLHEVPPSERLLLLKTFESDTQKYIHLLTSIKAKIDTISKLPTDEYSLIEDFIEDASKSINFNEKVINNLDKVKKPNLTPSVKVQLANDNNMKSLRLPKLREITATKKITRDQIINQVIRNRIQQYIKNKEASDRFYFNDITYDIAKKILVHLELGNDQLARELFKIFVSEKQKSVALDDGNKDDGTLTQKNWRAVHSRPKSIEPLVEFRDAKLPQDKDQIIKQLLQLRNIKF